MINDEQQDGAVEPQPPIDALLQRLSTLLGSEDNSENRWEIGDLINRVRSLENAWTFERLADHFSYSRSRLIQFSRNSARWSPEDRGVNVPFIVYEYVGAASERVAREESLHTGTEVTPDYVGDLHYIAAQRRQGERLTDQRAITDSLGGRARKRYDASEGEKGVLIQLRNKDALNRFHNRPCGDVIRELADGSVRLLHLDPPYANYRRDADGHLDMSTSTAQTACDNSDLAGAVAVTVDAIRAGYPKLATNGVMLVWAASTMPRGEIAAVVDELSLGGVPFIIWNKRRHQPGDFVESVQYSTEVCFVLCRRNEKPLIYDKTVSKGQVIDDVPPLQFSVASVQQHHQMEKPVELLERLIRQFTREGDTLVDGFGCSGSCCVAAERLGRNWVYCESNAQNFALGSGNIGREVLATQARADHKRSA